VIYKVEDGRLIVEPVPSIEEILKELTFVEVNLEEFHRFRKTVPEG
jgi:hypothetical protein